MSKQNELAQLADAVTVDGSNVGIGTSSPAALIDLKHNSASTHFRLTENTSGNWSALGVDTSDNLRIYTNNDERMRIDSSGQLLHGISSTPTGVSLGRQLISSSSTGSEIIAFREDSSVAVGDKCGALLIGNSDPDGAEDHFVGMWGKASSTNGSQDLHFAAGRSGYEGDVPQMTLHNSGNVGIGTSSPSEKLHISTGVNSFPATSGSTQTGAALRLRGGDNAVLDMGLNSVNTWLQATDKSGLHNSYNICLNPKGGNVLVNTTDSSEHSDGFRVLPNGSGSGTMTVCNNDGSGIGLIVARGGSDGVCTLFRRGSTSVGSITVTGSSASYNTSSDYRLKENVVDLTGASARVNQLNPSRFNFIADADTTVDGFLAHEVATVVPEAITGTHDEVEVWKDGDELPDGVSVGDNKLDDDGNTIPVYQGIDQSKLVPLLTAALQEALTEIASLKTRVEALEA